MSYTQLCVLPGVTDELNELGPLLENAFGCRFKVVEAYITRPDKNGPGGRRDVLFYVHDDDAMKFAIPRLQYSISWWEDHRSNRRAQIPPSILKKYPKTW